MSEVAEAPELAVIDDPAAAAALASPLRRRLLEQFAEPASATSAARAIGLSRQLAAYHVRELERHGYLRLVHEEPRRGCVERLLQRTAQQFTPSARLFGGAAPDARRLRDRASAAYLTALATQAAHEVGQAHCAAQAAGRTLPTLAISVDVALVSPKARQEFAHALAESVAALAARFNRPGAGARHYRVLVGSYPAPQEAP